ncbi:MAG: ABC transporter ATP-binding protein [Mesorhizobium sp.]|nr:ABC transporter ATP-binding protein [Mesorhizobium sp. M7A.F.Ca.ET.027.02.1.1]RWC26302.1 MAG: ABC transporter ATP-binding protein [Mesorhizobium sp.]RWD08650.1 MAG: ABC transporter ATP-binding protein [Mesorhizobium sp.]
MVFNEDMEQSNKGGARAMASISLEGLSKQYGQFRALERLDFVAQQGEFVTILGPSGSGKTTVLSLIAGLTEPTTGRIVLGGRDVTATRPAKRNIGLVFQSYALFPHMSVFDNVAFPLKVRGVPAEDARRRVGDALDLVRLRGFEARRPTQLSGGQQQRVAFARAIVFQPDILLLDEPLAALDRMLREQLQVELKQLQRKLGITTILVTHDQEEALSLSDRVLVLADGAVQQIAEPLEAYTRPANRFVAGFLGTTNCLDGEAIRHGAGNWVIRLRSGEELPYRASDEPSGSLVTISIRPEHVRVLGPNSERGVPATVIESVYLGQTVRYHVETVHGTPLIAACMQTGQPYPPGASVRLDWDAEAVWLIPEGGTSRAKAQPAAPELLRV